MRTTRWLVRTGTLVAGAVGMVAATAPEGRVGRLARRARDRMGRDVRYAVASAPGVLYRLAGRRPDPNVADDVLADRIRSTLGPLERRLDVPRVHVMVADHVAVLHGDVPSRWHARALEHAVGRVSGVRGVESHLHPGLATGDSRPSAGRAAPRPPSAALGTLLDAARRAGAHDPRAAVHAVLCGFGERIPEAERAQVHAHLPEDVRALAGPPRRLGARAPRLRTLPQLVAAVTAEGGVEPGRAEAITRAVVGSLRAIVPDEAHDVAAVLPAELRALWDPAPALAHRLDDRALAPRPAAAVTIGGRAPRALRP
jgi:uncharacterized protein (DUF2267 family)